MGVSKTALNIIKQAIKIRMARGEGFNQIIVSYPKLSAEQVEQLRKELE